MTITRLKASIFQAVFTSPILTFTVLFHLNLFFLKKINSQSPYYESNTSFLKTHLPFVHLSPVDIIFSWQGGR